MKTPYAFFLIMTAFFSLLPEANAVTNQGHFRWRNDDGSEVAASYRRAQDANDTLVGASNIRLRIELYNDNASGASSRVVALFYSKDGSNYTRITRSGSPNHWQLSLSSHFADGDGTTDQLSNSTVNAVSGRMVDSAESVSSTLNALTSQEFEFCITPTADAVTGNYFFQIRLSNGSLLDAYIRTPQLYLSSVGTISGMKWYDMNGDSVKNPGEPGLEGWIIVGQDSTTGTTYSDTTDANGNYSLSLPPGTYYAEEIQRAGWITTAGPTGTVHLGERQTIVVDFGNTQVETDTFPQSLGRFTLLKPGGGSETLVLSGPTTVKVWVGSDGRSQDSDGDGLDQVEAEMVEMSLTGMSSLGPVLLRESPTRRTLGSLEEVSNNTPGTLDIAPFTPTGAVNSFFDVFVEVSVSGMVLHSETPLHMTALLNHKPPGEGEEYTGIQTVELLDQNGNPTGISITDEHHIPNPPIEIDVFPASRGSISLRYPDSSTEIVTLNGPTTVHVIIPATGDAADMDGDGLDEVQTEMVQMDLTGTSSLGPLRVRESPTLPSMGKLEEVSNNTPGKLDVAPFAPTGSISSFFDVFFEIDVAGQTYHGATPLHMTALLTHKPPAPGEQYTGLQPVELLDTNGNPTGIVVTQEFHTPNPILTGRICIRKYFDINHNLQLDAGEPPMSGVSFVLSQQGCTTATCIDTVVTDVNGMICFNDLIPGTYDISEIVPPGYTQLMPVENIFTVTVLEGSDTTVVWLNGSRRDTSKYRTASMNDWATDTDLKGKLKAEKCKPDKVEFCLYVKNNIGLPVNDLHMEFSHAIDTSFDFSTIPPSSMTAAETKLKKWDFRFATLMAPGESVIVCGWGNKGKEQKIPKYYWTLNGQKISKNLKDVTFTKNQTRLPMPNLHNVGDELFLQQAFPFTIGAPSGANSVLLQKYRDVLKSLNNKNTLHTGTASCLILPRQVKNLPPDKQNNKLFAEALTLKLNILASVKGKFPEGLCDLIYDNSASSPSSFDGKTICAIMDSADVFLSCARASLGTADDYFNVLKKINDAFSGKIDTVVWSCTKMELKGVKSLSEVPYLRANPGAASPKSEPSTVVEYPALPTQFALQQNYPNPFNPTTTIEFNLPEPAIVTLKIYNTLGQEVAVLLTRELFEDGSEEVDFDAGQLPSGVYFYRIIAQTLGDDDEGIPGETFVSVKKMILIK